MKSGGFALASPSQARAEVLHLTSQKPQLTFPDSSHCLLTTNSYKPCILLGRPHSSTTSRKTLPGSVQFCSTFIENRPPRALILPWSPEWPPEAGFTTSELHMHPFWASDKILNASDVLLMWKQQHSLRKRRISSSCHRNSTASEESSCKETKMQSGARVAALWVCRKTDWLLTRRSSDKDLEPGWPASELIKSPPSPSVPAELSHTPPRGADCHSTFGCPDFPVGLLQLESKNLPETVLRRRI